MAKRDEKIRLVLEAEGAAEVQGLAGEVTALGDASSEAAKQADKLLDEIADAGKLKQAAGQLRETGKAVLDYNRQLRTAAESAAALSDREKELATAEAQKSAALAAAKRELAAYTDGTRTFLGTAKQVKAAQAEQREEVKRLTAEYRAAVEARRAVTTELEREREAATRTSAARERELAQAKLLRAELEAGGVSAAKLGAAEAELANRAQASAAAMRKLAAETKAAATAAEQKAAADARAQTTATSMARAYEIQADALRAISRTERDAATTREGSRRAIEQINDSLQQQMRRLAALRTTLEQAGASTAGLAQVEQRLVQAAQQATAAITRNAAEGEKARGVAERLAAVKDRLAKSFTTARESINAAARSLLQFTGIAGAVSTALSALGVGRLFSGAIESATQFQATLTTIGAVTGANKTEMAAFKKAAEDATKTTNFGASEAAEALLELAKTSGDAATATAQLAPTLNLAQAAGIGTAESAQILTTTITQFGLAATDAAHVADVFTVEVNSTEDSVSQLGNAMRYVAPLAKNLGLTLEDTTAIIGALAKAGFRGETAGTALRNVFSQLGDPASKFREALRGLGIESTNFIEVLQGIVKAGDKGSLALQALDTEARPAIQALVNTGGGYLLELRGILENVGGASERQARKIGQSFEGATARLRNAFDQLRRDLVDPILDPLATQFDDVAGRIRAFAQGADFKTIIEAVKTFALDATKSLIEFGRGINYTDVAAKIKSFVADAGEFFKNLRENIGTTISAVKIAGSTISVIFNGIQTVILGVAAVVTTALSLWGKSMLKLVEAAQYLPGATEALTGVAEKLRETVNGLDAVTDEYLKLAKKNAGETGAAFEGLAKNIEEAGEAGNKAAPGVEKAGTAAEQTADKVFELGNQLQLTTDWVAAARDQVTLLPGPLGDAGAAAAAAVGPLGEFKTAAEKLAHEALVAAQDEAYAASTALADLTKAGQTNGPVFEAAYQRWAEASRRLEELRGSSGNAAVKADELRQAYERLGVVSQASLVESASNALKAFENIRNTAGNTTEGINKTREAFISYAKAVLASVAASDAATKASAEAKLRELAAQVQALDQLDALLKKQDAVGKSAQDTGRKQQVAGDQGQQAFKKTEAAAKGAEKGIKEAGKAAESVSVSFASIGRESFKSVADLYSLVLARKASVRELEIAIKVAEERLKSQQRAAAATIESYKALDQATIDSMIRRAGSSEAAAEQLRKTAQRAREGKSALRELDQATLNNLAAAADQAAAKLQEITNKAREAKDEIAGIGDSLQDEIDRANGNEVAIENRRYAEQLRRLRELAEIAGADGAAEAQRAIERANQLHQIRLQQIAKEKAARAESESGGGGGGSGQGGGGGNGPGGPFNPRGGGMTFNIHIDGDVIGGTADQIASKLARIVAPELRRMAARGYRL